MSSLVITLLGLLLNGVISHRSCGYDAYKANVLANDKDGSIHKRLNNLETNFESEKHKHLAHKMLRKQSRDRRGLQTGDFDGKDFSTSEYFQGILEIPVIVHILYRQDWHVHNTGLNTNDWTTYEKIQSQLLRLNTDYLAENTDPLALNDWYSDKANYNIAFKLSEVRRVESNVAQFNWGSDQEKSASDGGSNNVDPKHYLNLYVADPVPGNDGLTSLGRCTFPGLSDEAKDGCVINPAEFGDASFEFIKDDVWKNGMANGLDWGRTATHEVGHWFYLDHTFGTESWIGHSDCFDTDRVSDTPNQGEPNQGCPTTFGDFTGFQSCGTYDMYQNYMDYSDDHCMGLFTNGQLERSLSIFKLSYENGGRKELTDYQNTMGNDRYVNDLYFVVSSQATANDNICGPTDSIIPDFRYDYENGKHVYACASTTNNPYVKVINGNDIKISTDNSSHNCLQIIEDNKYLCYSRVPFTDTINRITASELESKLFQAFESIF